MSFERQKAVDKKVSFKLSPRDATPSHTANRPPVPIQRIPEILDVRHPLPGGPRLEASSSEQTQAAGTLTSSALGPRREKTGGIQGEGAQASGYLSRSPRREKARHTEERAPKPLAA